MSPGENGITAEHIRHAGDRWKTELYHLILSIWREERMPKCWGNATIIPILKGGDETDCNNYRGISLVDVAYKIMAIIIKKKVEMTVETQIGEYQAGFRKGRGTTDQILIIKEVLTTCYEYRIPDLFQKNI